MRKVLIEVMLDDDQPIPTADDIKRLTSRDWIADWWHIDDVKGQYDGDEEYSDLTDDQCREVLALMLENKDACTGFNWDVVAECTEIVLDYERVS